MTNKEIKEKLGCDTCSRKGDVITIRRGFYFPHGKTAATWEAKVKEAFPSAEIIESNQIWKPFRGDATVAQGSHFVVKFRIPD